jgi:protocatechuate 3,4-dioxygenase beta subunit
MSNPSRALGAAALNRRELLGRAANAAAILVVSQAMSGCSSNSVDGTGNDSTTLNPSCVLTASLTEGPYFVDEKLLRADIRTDPVTGAVSQGTPLALSFNVMRVASTGCTALTGAYLDVWHCDAAGVYSDVSGAGSGRRFLRGYQLTDATGVVQFTTAYPGWYQGRAVHIHFKLRLFAGATKTYEFTSQFFFDETTTDTVHAVSPYSSKGRRDTLNTNDGIYNGLSAAQKTALTLKPTLSGSNYAGVINLGVTVA